MDKSQPAIKLVSLYEGYVRKVEKTANQKWILVHTKENVKPLAILAIDFAGALPKLGDKITVEGNEGAVWFFCSHRSIVVIKQEPFFPLEGLPNANQAEIVGRMIMWKLMQQSQICADDIYAEARRIFPDKDPRFIGHGFRLLAKQGLIHKVGMRKSERTEANHARDVSVWEEVRKR